MTNMTVLSNKSRFERRMEFYDRWRSALTRAIEEYQAWLDDQQLGDPELDLRIYEVLESLRNDRLNIAFVAEFSRGKTELINAIFFSDYERRLLPSEAGRTTMCPTELFYDREEDQAYIRLLPIETRLKDKSIAEYKQEPIHWTSTPLNMDMPDQMSEALSEVVRTKRVPLEEARRLGLYNPEEHGGEVVPSHVEIPMWRHALISFPHPLLKQGLAVVDTPGLNALGAEPELTLNLLPGAQAVLFVLGADTGVTRSDLDMWRYYVKGSRGENHEGLVVALNKVDTLWDDLKSEKDIEASIKKQCQNTAEILGVDTRKIFPISAQKALLAKIRRDQSLLERSHILELESYLANDILPSKQEILRKRILSDIGNHLENNLEMVATRLKTGQKQVEELRTLAGKNADVIVHLMRKVREEQASYLKNVESFQASRRVLGQQTKAMMNALSLDTLDQLLNQTRADMGDSWTTAGLKKGMKTFFVGVQDTMDQVSQHADETRRLVSAIYQKFHKEHAFPAYTPKVFTLESYGKELKALSEEAELFRKSPLTTMTEKGIVIKKFMVSLASRARDIFFRASQETDAWIKEVMSPLVTRIKEHKQSMEKRLETLRKISESRDTLESKIRELNEQNASLQSQFDTLQRMHTTLNNPLQTESAQVVTHPSQAAS